MKRRKYVLLILTFLTALLCSVGSSLWLVLDEKNAKPEKFNGLTTTLTLPVLETTVYYGQEISLEGSTVTTTLHDNTTKELTKGTWSADGVELNNLKLDTTTTKFNKSGTTETFDISLNIKFTPEDNSLYTVAETTLSLKVKAVAKVNSTFYTTIDGALATVKEDQIDTTTSTTVYSLPNSYSEEMKSIGAKTIHTTSIDKQATLCLPYSDTTYSNREGTNSAFADTAESTYLKNYVTVAEGATLTNNGTIIIGGILGTTSESGNQGHTSADYAQINMGSNSHIENAGTIECYGFIKDNNDSTINNTGTIKAPFVVYDYRGPSHTVGAYKAANAGISPFNIFDMPNIYSEITTHSTATINGFLDLYTQHDTLGAQHNLDEITIFASSNAVIDLHNDASVIMDFFTTASPTKTLGSTDLHFSGGADSGVLSIGVKFLLGGTIPIIDETIKMEDVLFPISWKFNITFDNGTYDINNQYKLMPGSKVTITESATTNVSSNIILYAKDFKYQYPAQSKDATLQVNGTLNINSGSFGGYITPGENSTLAIADNVELSLESIEGAGLFSYGVTSGISYSFTKNSASPTKSLTLPMYNGSSSTVKSAHTNTTYKSINSAWCPETVSITYNSMGGSAIENTSGHSVYANGYTIPSSINENIIPTRTNYSFVGWYLDSAYTQNAVGATIWDYTTVYAKWEQDTSKILAEFKLIGSNDLDLEAMKHAAFASQEMSDTVTTVTQPNVDSEYQFNIEYTRYIVGFYSDSSGTTEFDFSQKITQNTTIYVKWDNKYTLKITLKTPSGGSAPTAIITTNNKETDIISDKTYHLAKEQEYTIEASNYSDSTITLGTKIPATGNVTATITGKEGGCVAAGTLITLADGTQKKVEDLLETDTLLVFDHETGKYVEAGILFIERDGWDYYNVINLEFSDGRITRLIYEHGLFDLTQNKYVYIDETNYASFIGHEFAVIGENGSYDKVTLEKAYITNEYTGCYSLDTVYHINFFIDGLFSMPGGIDGLFNIFEYGDGLKYDEEKMQEDIEKYGLFTYEDFEEYIPIEIYEAFPAPYFKVAIGKGMLTFETLLEYIEQFIIKNGLM